MIAILSAALASAALPACTATQITLDQDAQGGAFNGMSHSGALLVVRNLGPGACAISPYPFIGFLGADGDPLPITPRTVPAQRAGILPRPIGIAPGAEATAPLRWVSGAVYDRNRCLTTATLTIAIGRTLLRTPLEARICGPAGAAVSVEQPPLRTDPVLAPR